MADSPVPGFRKQNEIADNECLFRAVSRQLHGTPARFQEIRDRVVRRYYEIYRQSATFSGFWDRFGAEIIDGIRQRFPHQSLDDNPEYIAVLAEQQAFQAEAEGRNLTEEDIARLADYTRQIETLQQRADPDFENTNASILFILYIYLFRYEGVWGGAAELETMAQILNVDIHLYQPTNEAVPYIHYPPQPGDGANPELRQIYVLYDGGAHYDSLILLPGMAVGPGGYVIGAEGAGAGGPAGGKAAAKPAVKSRAVSASKLPFKTRVTQTIIALMAEAPNKVRAEQLERDSNIIRQQEANGKFDTKATLARWIAANQKAGQFDIIATRYGIKGGGKAIVTAIQSVQSGGARKTKKALRKRKTQKKK